MQYEEIAEKLAGLAQNSALYEKELGLVNDARDALLQAERVRIAGDKYSEPILLKAAHDALEALVLGYASSDEKNKQDGENRQKMFAYITNCMGAISLCWQPFGLAYVSEVPQMDRWRPTWDWPEGLMPQEQFAEPPQEDRQEALDIPPQEKLVSTPREHESLYKEAKQDTQRRRN